MYTEILKIIEGGLSKDVQKVQSYVRLLVENLKKDGDEKTAERISRLLNNQKAGFVFQDQLMVAPVDQESRLNMADILMPTDSVSRLVLSAQVRESVDDFIATQKFKNEIIKKGIEVNSSVLLFGPPGCGKTSIAKHIAKTLELPLIVTRFDSLISSLLGNTGKNIRKIFEYANSRPCILFLDEFDAIAKARDDQHEMGELKRVINSLLQNIDEFTKNNILIAATNHPDLLDRAIWRRFNSIIEVPLPTRDEIEELLKLSFGNVSNDFINGKYLNDIAEAFSGMSQAQIKTVSNAAITKNIIRNKKTVQLEDILQGLFIHKNNNNYTLQGLITFFHEKGLSQNSIADHLNISKRQVANHINKKS